MSDNDVHIEDVGDYYRVYGPYSVVKATEIPFLSKDGVDTGIRYAIGTDTATGETKVAWVDYPKSVFTYDDLVNNPRIMQIFRRCNVCLAMDRIRSEHESSDSASRSSVTTARPAPEYSQNVHRLSLGDVALPKYVPLLLQLSKSLFLTKFGDLTVSILFSLLTDVLSGMTSDPFKRDVLRSTSDAIASETLYSLGSDDIEQLKKDLAQLSSAYQSDRSIVSAIMKAAVKNPLDNISDDNKSKPRARSTQIGQVRAFRGVLD